MINSFSDKFILSVRRLLFAFLLILGSALVLLTSATSLAEFLNPYPVPSVQVQGLSAYKDKDQYLTAYYINGNPGSLSVSPENVNVYLPFVTSVDYPITGDSITLDAQNIAWQGNHKPNILLLVVHSGHGFIWKNGTDNLDATAVSAVFIDFLRNNASLQSGQNHSVNFTFDPNKPLSGN